MGSTRRRRRLVVAATAAVGLAVVGQAATVPGSVGHVEAATACALKQGPVGSAFPDCSGGQVFNIVPPGETGTYNTAQFLQAQAGLGTPAHTDDQEKMYADLVRVAPNLSASAVSSFYKDAAFYTDAIHAERVETFPAPHSGTVILRDSQFGVPHIFGVTRADTEFGSGYASAEDRLFEMDVLRHVGRAQLTSFIGPSASNEAMDCSVAESAGYSETELQQQVDNFAALHPKPITIDGKQTTEGQQIKDDAS